MHTIQRVLIGLFATLIAATSFASADHGIKDFYDAHRHAEVLSSGFYVDGLLGGGYQVEHSKFNNGYAGVINAGYQFTPKFGTEIGVAYLPNVRAPDSTATHDFSVYDAAIKSIGNYGHFSVFGKLGIAMQYGKITENSGATFLYKKQVALYTGGGVGYHVTPHVEIVADLTSSYSGEWNTSTYTGGINYLF